MLIVSGDFAIKIDPINGKPDRVKVRSDRPEYIRHFLPGAVVECRGGGEMPFSSVVTRARIAESMSEKILSQSAAL